MDIGKKSLAEKNRPLADSQAKTIFAAKDAKSAKKSFYVFL